MKQDESYKKRNKKQMDNLAKLTLLVNEGLPLFDGKPYGRIARSCVINEIQDEIRGYLICSPNNPEYLTGLKSLHVQLTKQSPEKDGTF